MLLCLISREHQTEKGKTDLQKFLYRLALQSIRQTRDFGTPSMGRWIFMHQLHHNLRQGEQLGRGGVHLRQANLATVLDPHCKRGHNQHYRLRFRHKRVLPIRTPPDSVSKMVSQGGEHSPPVVQKSDSLEDLPYISLHDLGRVNDETKTTHWLDDGCDFTLRDEAFGRKDLAHGQAHSSSEAVDEFHFQPLYLHG
ncbi:hypothetical protein N7494_005402 [Penicillium frequentans]|uniref:Uncharacterized protein n=1 Tax=Penicillium frequentans TaxID=3151616 RepID=A0AAD6CY14_9EURO|nr:hypothetical protein N7494_005402 [Penicillium glabrum]